MTYLCSFVFKFSFHLGSCFPSLSDFFLGAYYVFISKKKGEKPKQISSGTNLCVIIRNDGGKKYWTHSEREVEREIESQETSWNPASIRKPSYSSLLRRNEYFSLLVYIISHKLISELICFGLFLHMDYLGCYQHLVKIACKKHLLWNMFTIKSLLENKLWASAWHHPHIRFLLPLNN